MKVRSFINFLLDHFSEDDNIDVNHCCDGGCLLRKMEAGDADDTLIWVVDGDNETYYHGEWIDQQNALEDTNKL